jgi:xanthine dehydrogenase accessory factor
MKEILNILQNYDRWKSEGHRFALATVVRVEGSSYRRTGARMLVREDGIWVGGISGGCLEKDALKRAARAIAKDIPSVVTYDTTQDDAHQIGVGLGCNGVIDVLFTPLASHDKYHPVEILKASLQGERTPKIFLSVIHAAGEWGALKQGQFIEYHNAADLHFIQDKVFEETLECKIMMQREKQASALLNLDWTEGRSVSLFIEILLPQTQVIFMGNQYDLSPMVQLAAAMGWRSILVANPLKLSPAVFSLADAVCPETEFPRLKVDRFTAIVLMAHDYKTDLANLSGALLTPAFYIGLLGPLTRAEKMFREIHAAGKILTDGDKNRIYAPAGLDLGALSPEEIALSVFAEIRTVLSGRQGGSLKFRQSPIHGRD